MEFFAPIIVLCCAIIALIFSFSNFYAVKKRPEGTETMSKISAKIRKGAMAYLKRQIIKMFYGLLFPDCWQEF